LGKRRSKRKDELNLKGGVHLKPTNQQINNSTNQQINNSTNKDL